MLAINHDSGEHYTTHLSKAEKYPSDSKAISHKSNCSNYVLMVKFFSVFIIYTPHLWILTF